MLQTGDSKQHHEDKDYITCSTCKASGTSATVYCLDCKEHLCQNCHASHQSFKALKDHKVISIKDHQSGAIPPLWDSKEDQHCSEHDGELKRFYCNTCVKLICRDCVVVKKCCRDHQYVTLTEAAKKQTSRLVELLQKSRGKAKECQDAIQETEEVEKDFKAAAGASKEAVSQLRAEYVSMMEQIFAMHENELKTTEAKKAQQLDQIKTDLQSKLEKIQSAIDLGTKVSQMGTDFEIATRFTSLSGDLQKIISSQPVPADSGLGQIKINIPIISFQSSKPWNYVGKFTTTPRVYSPHGITIHHDGDIAIASSKNVQVFSRDGSLLYSFKSPQSHQITVTPDKKYILSAQDGTTYYDFHRKQESQMSILDDSMQPINPISLAIDSDGKLITASGDIKGTPSWIGLITAMIVQSSHQPPKISIHQPDGSFISSFTPDAIPRQLDVTPNHDIIVTLDNDSVQLIDYTGNNIRTLASPPEVDQWLPQNVCCGKNNLFIVNAGEPMAVHRYTISGIYLGVVISLEDVQMPVDVAVSPDDLEVFVINRKAGCVQIYKNDNFQ